MTGEFKRYDGFLVLPLRGHLEPWDFPLLGSLIATRSAAEAVSRFLLDWSDVSSWNFRKPTDRELRVWLEDVSRIDRLAILHNSVANRQAALIGAALRERRCQVRSYRIADRDLAIDWLSGGSGNRPAGGLL